MPDNANEQQAVDPSVFNDPLALETEWTPAKAGGAVAAALELRKTKPGRYEYCRFNVMSEALGRRALFGLFLAFAGAMTLFIGSGGEPSGTLFAGLFMLAGVAWVGCAHRFYRRVFDINTRYYHVGLLWAQRMAHQEDCPALVRLDQVHALQLIRKRFTVRTEGFTVPTDCYELNFILHNADRVTIIEHGEPALLRVDAAILGRLLNVPVWDAT